MRKFAPALALVLALRLAFAGPLLAATYTWSPPSPQASDNWTDTSNWLDGAGNPVDTYPKTLSDTAILSKSDTITLNAALEGLASMLVSGGTLELTLAHDLALTDLVINPGSTLDLFVP